MKDKEKKKEELMSELAELRQRITELEASEAERKRAEEALQESEERFRQMFSHMSSGVAVYEAAREGEDFIIKDFNEAAAKIERVAGEKVIGKSVLEAFPGVKDLGLFEVFQRVWRTGKPEYHPIGLYKDKRIEGWRENYVYKLPSGEVVAIYDDITERKRAQEALRESEELLRSILNTLPVGVWVTDSKGQILSGNLAGQRIWAGARLVGIDRYGEYKGWWAGTGKRIEADEWALARAITKGETSLDEVIDIECFDGSRKTILNSAVPIRGPGRQIVGAIVVNQDITERRRAEEALQESEERYRAIMEQSPDGIFLEDIDRRCLLEANVACQRMLGYSPQEITGLSIYDIVAADRDDMDRKLQEILTAHDSFTHERQYRRKDGSLLDVWLNSKVISFGGKKVNCTLVRDLTARKQAEKTLQESEERYRAIMEGSPDGIFLTTAENLQIVQANNAFCDLLGYSLEEIVGMSLYDIVAADREDIDRRFQEKLERERPLIHERQYRRKDGSLVDVWISAKVIAYGDRKVTCAIIRDLTEKKAIEAQLLRAQRTESIGLLAGGIAHDLNNILSPILMNVELLQRQLPDHKLLSSISSSAQRGAEIVKQILNFARGMEGELLAVSPKYLLQEMKRLLQETFPKSITIETEIGKDLWSLQGDPTQLHQVLLNLCLNAKDAMEKGGKLTLSAENLSLDEAYAGMHPSAQVGPYLLFTVADTGKGIPPEHLDRIFDPFFTTKERGQGTGLGLSTVHGIVKGHGGFLNVYSELGRGTKFRVYLPASPSAEMAKAKKERAPLPSGKGELILVVEDEASIREITQAALEACGYQVMAACDGSEAVALYAQHGKEIQAVITDMAMPIMDGAATIRALQKMNPEIKVIATTGMDADKVVSEMNREVVKAFLQKPFTAERLLRTLAEVLKG
jgi:PAS domain S-box-containing protein